MNDTADTLLASLPDTLRRRVLSLRTATQDQNGSVTLVLDGNNLDQGARTAMEAEARSALSAQGVYDARIAVMADKASSSAPIMIAVGSGKGGVGKSTLSANLAVALHRMGHKVGLVDADIYGPSQPRLLANEGMRPEARDDKLVPIPSPHGPLVLSMGHLIPADQAIAWRGPMASNALSQLIEADWGDTEVLIIDLPPGTGDVQLTMVQRFKPAGALVVSTPQDLALMDAVRAIHLFETVQIPVIGLVENMAGYVCPHCGGVSDPFGNGGVEAAAKERGLAFLGRVPLTLAIRQSSDSGQPSAAGDTEEGQAFTAIATRLARWIENHTHPTAAPLP